ncbi:MAG: hypothetical protein ABI360_02895 [Allobranchiibius sp.]
MDENADQSSRPVLSAGYLAVWGFGFLILRIFAVSGYKWETAFAVSTVLSLNDAVPIVFGSLMAGYLLTAFGLMVVVPMLLAAAIWRPGRDRLLVVLLTALGTGMLLAVAASFVLWWLPLAAAAIFAVLAIVHALPPEHLLRQIVMATLAKVGRVSGVAALVIAAAVQTPWVPLEQISVRTGDVSGYVLSVDPGFLNVLSTDHEFLILISSDVTARR